jgi:hypothetical protein
MPQSLTVFALYGSRDAAESAADKLIQSGVTSSNISVLLPEQVPALTHDTRLEPNLANQTSTAPTSRGIFSGALGVLAGLSMLALPGLGPLVGEGTLKAGLTSLGVSGAVGNFAKYLINLGVPELEAKRYEDRLQQQAVLFTVRCDTPEQAGRLSEPMNETGAQDLCTVVEPSTSGGVAAPTAAEPTPAAHKTYRFIGRTMYKTTPEEFAEESAVDDESNSLPLSNRTSAAKS